MRKRLMTALVSALVLASVVPAFAQRFEFGVSWSIYDPGFDSSYAHRYSPPYLSAGAYSSLAEQTLKLSAKSTNGLSVLVNYFPTSNIGLQFLADYFKADLEGTNSPYAYSLTYQRPMPDHTFQTVTHSGASEWQATEGDIREIVLSLNAIVRLPLTRSLSLSLSGGPSYFYTEAKAGYIGYQTFWTGDDRLLHIRTFRLGYEFGPQSKIGLNLGAEAALHLSGTISIVGEYRYFKCAGTETSLHISPTDILDEELADVEARMNLGSLKVEPSYSRFSAGLKFSF
jgi:hypothetical protein